DGDGKTDLALWRPTDGTWHIAPSNGTPPITPNIAAAQTTQWGLPGDIPITGDFDGDGKADLALWRPVNATWYIIQSTNPTVPLQVQFGFLGDVPVAGDFDGSGKQELA